MVEKAIITRFQELWEVEVTKEDLEMGE